MGVVFWDTKDMLLIDFIHGQTVNAVETLERLRSFSLKKKTRMFTQVFHPVTQKWHPILRQSDKNRCSNMVGMFNHIHCTVLTWFLHITICSGSSNNINWKVLTHRWHSFCRDSRVAWGSTDETSALILIITTWKSNIVVLIKYAQCFI